MATFGDSVSITGFGNSDVNGIYYYAGEFNGQAFYQNGVYYIMYSSKLGPWSEAEAYYIIEKKQIQGSIPILKPLYRLSGSSPNGTTEWDSLSPSTSGEQTVGATAYEEASSSSSIDSSSSSSDSSSSDSSQSSSSSSSDSSQSSSSSSSDSSQSSSSSSSSL